MQLYSLQLCHVCAAYWGISTCTLTLGAKLISALSVPLALGSKLTYILHDITLTDWLKVPNTAFTWHVIIVAFSIVAGLKFVAKFGHNHLCVYMAVLIYRTRALCTTK